MLSLQAIPTCACVVLGYRDVQSARVFGRTFILSYRQKAWEPERSLALPSPLL